MLIYLVAGETSGDVLGARLMAALKELAPGEVAFAGIGGPEMAAQGLESLFPISDLAVMGLVEVLPRAPALLRRLRQTALDIEARKPDLLVTIDSPDYAYRLAARLPNRRLQRVHYVAPSVWAWRPGRVHTFRRHFDHVMALLPFEPQFFDGAGLPCTHVGHPVVESGLDKGDGVAFRGRHDIRAEQTVLSVLPGSRMGEVRRLLPVFLRALDQLRQRWPDLHAVVPTVPAVAEMVETANWPVPATFVGAADKADAFAASNAAIAASGTVTLELALAGVPHLVGYRVNVLTAPALRAMLRVSYVNLINLVLDRPAVPELLQRECTSSDVARETARLLGDEPARVQQRRDFAEAMGKLGYGEQSPSRRVAEEILKFMRAATSAPKSRAAN